MKAFNSGLFRLFLMQVIIVVCLFYLPTYMFAFQNEPLDGFEGIKWGTDIKNVPNMVFSSKDDGLKGLEWYTKKDGEQIIGEMKVDKINYGFYKNRFAHVYIYFGSRTNLDLDRLKKYYFNLYGETPYPKMFIANPDGPGGIHAEQCIWKGDTVKIVLNIRVIEEDKKHDESGAISYSFMPIAQEENQTPK